MISPQLYVEKLANKSYHELLVERDEFLKKIFEFENNLRTMWFVSFFKY